MGCGNLILAHDDPFNRETLAEEGLYFRTVEQLLDTINEVDVRRNELDSLRTGARERARTCYQWTDVIECYAELLRQEGRSAG